MEWTSRNCISFKELFNIVLRLDGPDALLFEKRTNEAAIKEVFQKTSITNESLRSASKIWLTRTNSASVIQTLIEWSHYHNGYIICAKPRSNKGRPKSRQDYDEDEYHPAVPMDKRKSRLRCTAQVHLYRGFPLSGNHQFYDPVSILLRTKTSVPVFSPPDPDFDPCEDDTEPGSDSSVDNGQGRSAALGPIVEEECSGPSQMQDVPDPAREAMQKNPFDCSNAKAEDHSERMEDSDPEEPEPKLMGWLGLGEAAGM